MNSISICTCLTSDIVGLSIGALYSHKKLVVGKLVKACIQGNEHTLHFLVYFHLNLLHFPSIQSLLLQAWPIPFVTKLRKKLNYWFVTSGGLFLWTIILLLFSILHKRNKESKVFFKGNQDFQFTSSQKKMKKAFTLD